MSSTQPLLDFKTSITLSRSNDPKSSKRAAEQIVKSGALKGQQATALKLIRFNPGRSTSQLGDLGPLDRYQIARRTKELWRQGLVLTVEIGKQDLKWYAIL